MTRFNEILYQSTHSRTIQKDVQTTTKTQNTCNRCQPTTILCLKNLSVGATFISLSLFTGSEHLFVDCNNLLLTSTNVIVLSF